MKIVINSGLIILSVMLFTQDIYAQYFGRNKIQYENFDFRILETDHFDIYYYPEEAEAVYDAAVMLERWNDRFSKIFGKSVDENQPIILYASHADFQQTNVIGGDISQGTGGVTEGLKNRIILPFTGVYAENDHVLGHELVHAFQYEILKSSRKGLAAQIPLWFIEGLAEYLSIGRNDPLTAMWMRDAVLNDDIPDIDDVSRSYRYFPYRYGHALWTYIAGRWGDEIILPLFKAAIDSGWTDAYEDILNYKIDTLSTEWQDTIRGTYAPQLEGKTKPADIGKVIRSVEEAANFSPVISPDGKYIALFTNESIFTLDLFLIDAASGEVISKLASSNTDRHFDALRFINSAGSWSPDSRSFAFVVIEEGDDQIAIVDVPSGKFKREIKVKNVSEISHLAWSPDGNSILISGTSGGISNLYLYDFTINSTEQLTNDKHADLQPDWSPDGNWIIFSSDRGEETDFTGMVFSPLKLALMELSTKDISVISISTKAKHINPQFSADGKEIFFVSDPDGFSNIYRYTINSGQFYKITNAATGISGLTESSPAISYSHQAHSLAFTVFDKGDYSVNLLQADELEGTLIKTEEDSFDRATAIPPVDKSNEGIVEQYIGGPGQGIPGERNYASKDYSPSLGLLFVGQPYVGASVSRFGTMIGGGVSLYFGDILGDHLLGSALQINGSLKDIGGEVFYMNQSGRFNWGGGIAHIPYLTGYVYGRYDTVRIGGNLYLAEETNLLRQRIFIDQASLLSEYPFSTNRRMEFSLGYTRYSYDYELETIVSIGPDIISEQTLDLDTPSPLNLLQGAVAYVGDYSFFGFTSPVDGSRFRFEFQPTVGSLQFASFLADYRKYFFFNPITIAVRGLHYGRYFGDSEDDRLSLLQVGYDTWVRGYNINSFDVSECSGSGNPGDCPEVDRLIGSKIGIFNLEVRVPFLGTEQFGIINLGFLPVELNAFLDGGIAWTNDEAPVFKFEERSMERIPVFSAGFSARINLFGYMIGEVYYAYPFQRPDKHWLFGFSLAPGW
ncbi:MAG: hypothetical protein R6W90_05245 [Ignavibacteriaceae bacterium]